MSKFSLDKLKGKLWSQGRRDNLNLVMALFQQLNFGVHLNLTVLVHVSL